MRTSVKAQEPVSTRRFVSGIKGPLTLQLTPRSLADVESSLPFNRSTVGSRNFKKNPGGFPEDRYSARQDGKYTRLPLPIRIQYRDTPVYHKPGSPQLSNFPISPPSSCGDTMDGSSVNTEIDGNYETMRASNAGQMTDHREYTNSWASIQTDLCRDSGLSFQCMGESPVPNDAFWFRRPSGHSDGNFAGPCPSSRPLVLSRSMPETRKVESWLSDASTSDDDDEDDEYNEDDVFAQATSLAPSKGRVIEVNTRRPFSLSISIPPRSSSLKGTHAWPVTPNLSNESWIEDESPTTPEFWTSPEPKRRSSIELFSPPASPGQHQHVSSTDFHPEVFPLFPDLELFGYPPTPSLTFTNSTLDVIEALEDSIAYFPVTKLMHDTPCIVRVRTLLGRSDGHLSKSPPQSLPLLNHNTPSFRPNTHHKRRVTFSTCTTDTSDSWSTYSQTPQTDNSRVTYQPYQNEPPNLAALQALRRIFPNSTRSTSALYAYILAYIFITDLQPFNDRSSIKAASILGISRGQLATHDRLGDGQVSASPLTRLEKGLMLCIRGLVQTIRESPVGAECLDTFLRSLVEVVRACEISA